MIFACVAMIATMAAAQPAAVRKSNSTEQRTAAHFQSIKHDPLLLRGFLRAMPKGGDLHNHVSGGVYAENYILWAVETKQCIDRATLSYVRPKESGCDAATQWPAAKALEDTVLYRELIDAMSMRNWHPARKPGEYQFFDTFGRFGAVSGALLGKTVAEAARRAADNNEMYLELIVALDGGRAFAAAESIQMSDDFEGLRQKLLSGGLQAPWAGFNTIAETEAAVKRELGCEQDSLACRVQVRFQCQVLRGMKPERVFAQTLACFELANSDAKVVALNLVQPEDSFIPMHNFDLHMRMLQFFKTKYPNVKLSLHAGELAFGQVPPEGLGHHVRKSLEIAGARRIGHGTDIMHDRDPAGLMAHMVKNGIAVEISLSSSDAILGIRGKHHPLRHYLKAGVPVTIATDDEGVARSDITNEYQRAVEEHGLSYLELKTISRNGLRHSFLPQAERSALLAELEKRFSAFEKRFGK